MAAASAGGWIRNFICDGVPEVEVVRAKTQLKANMLMQLDSFAHTCEDIGEL